MGVTIPHSMGLGGGCLIVFYNSTSKQTNTIDAREEAPQLVNKDIFNNRNTSYGPISIGIPGELAGYWELHQRFGRLKWNQLFDGAIKFSRNGFYVTKHMANACKWKENYIKSYSSLRY
jgi:gamma-glutamyltranspeptidase/glutathione hydrolase/leukotriene-C4 hydrolase